jgi:hypothetical protein
MNPLCNITKVRFSVFFILTESETGRRWRADYYVVGYTPGSVNREGVTSPEAPSSTAGNGQ